MTTIAMVKCEAGCGTSLRPGGGPYCSRCAQEAADLATQLEAKWQQASQHNPSYAALADRVRMARESLTAPVAGCAERRSALMARLPRVDAGLERWRSERPAEHRRINVSSVLIGLALACAFAWLACGR